MNNKDQLLLKNFYRENGMTYEIPETVYHYTSAASLLSIIENNSLWISDRKHMNDIMDSSYIEQKFRQGLSEHFNNTNLVSPLVPQYVFSTTKENDSYFHYSCYGNYCIGFNTCNLIDYFENCIANFGTQEGLVDPFMYQNVIYDESIVDKLCNIICNEYPKSLEKDKKTPFSPFGNFEGWRTIYMLFYAIIKQRGFLGEQEFRLLIETNHEKKFRCTKTEVIPYLELKLTEEKLPIESIRIGPLTNSNSYDCIKTLLYSNRYGEVKIIPSDLKIKLPG